MAKTFSEWYRSSENPFAKSSTLVKDFAVDGARAAFEAGVAYEKERVRIALAKARAHTSFSFEDTLDVDGSRNPQLAR